MVESRLPKPLVAGSIPVSRSNFLGTGGLPRNASTPAVLAGNARQGSRGR